MNSWTITKKERLPNGRGVATLYRRANASLGYDYKCHVIVYDNGRYYEKSEIVTTSCTEDLSKTFDLGEFATSVFGIPIRKVFRKESTKQHMPYRAPIINRIGAEYVAPRILQILDGVQTFSGKTNLPHQSSPPSPTSPPRAEEPITASAAVHNHTSGGVRTSRSDSADSFSEKENYKVG